MNEQQDQFWELLEPIYDQLTGFCVRLCGESDAGNDLLHDALLSAVRGFGDLRQSASFRPWLYRIIVTTYHGRFRSPWWKRKVKLTEGLGLTVKEQDLQEQHIARRQLDRALSILSSRTRALVVLHEVEGWSIAEISRMMSRSEEAVKVELSRARKKMRDAILKESKKNSPADKPVGQVYAELI